jgi:hypothetical protein
MVAAHDPVGRKGLHDAANDNVSADDSTASPANATAMVEVSPGTNPPDPSYIAEEAPHKASSSARVFCDIPDGLEVPGAEIEICETYLEQLIGGIIANDNEP